ncbi:hypothetical protein KDA_55820 [Dictyobacter alpinus]|uniref:N-acetyltransferase domain-containing protein n=1 Tax=Dictyobacter alpinus TaxID=2014873 RepID=A0A402BFD2_9CHLR|nr:GNAT family N-acetyltransferase [Dictyobacter alpinus]GCE30098.1 hypothetical protein KDA_55820 [Dictyobacter alpinus]
MSIASINIINQDTMNCTQTFSWFVRAANQSKEDQQYLTYMCYVSVFPMRHYPLPMGDERVVQRLPQIQPWRSGWGQPGDIAFLAIDPIRQQRLGAAWCRLFSTAHDFVPGFYSSTVPIVSLAVDVYARHQGIGGTLLQMVKQSAYQQGYTTLSLGVVSTSPAKFLYERYGFTVQNTSTYPALTIMTTDLTVPTNR